MSIFISYNGFFVVLIVLNYFNPIHGNYIENGTDYLKERTFIMCKPDGVQRGLVGETIKRFEAKGLKLVAMKLIQAKSETVAEHYVHVRDRPFYEGLISYMTSGPVVPMVWEGYNAVKFGRDIIGKTRPSESPRGTIRGDYCLQESNTVVHGAHSQEAARKEISLWFTQEEIVQWNQAMIDWLVYSD